MHPVALEFGPVQVYSFSLALIVAFAACWAVARLLLPSHGIPGDEALPLILTVALGGIIGARFAFVVAHWDYFGEHLIAIVRLNEGGLVFYGGVAGGVLAAWAYALVKDLPKGGLADVAAVAVPLGSAIGRVGCFLNGCCGGVASDLPWAMRFPGDVATVHPTQLYDVGYNLVLFGVMFLVVRRAALPPGAPFWLFLALYGSARFGVEAFRTQSVYVMGLSGAQVISVVLVPVAIAVFVFLVRRGRAGELDG